MLKKRWKSRTVMLILAMLGLITSLVLTNITVLAQTSSDRSAISQSSTNAQLHKGYNVRFYRNRSSSPINTNEVCGQHSRCGQVTTQNGASTEVIRQATISSSRANSPVMCRISAIRAVLRWKCPEVRPINRYGR